MTPSDEDKRRLDPRYVETSEDLSDWISVRVARQFGTQLELNGVLCDLTPRAIKVAFPATGCAEGNWPLHIGTQLLITFTFRDLSTVTATATITRLDAIKAGCGVVMHFDLIRENDRESINRICTAYNRGHARPPEDADTPTDKPDLPD